MHVKMKERKKVRKTVLLVAGNYGKGCVIARQTRGVPRCVIKESNGPFPLHLEPSMIPGTYITYIT